MRNAIVIGGGLGGLVTAIGLVRQGIQCHLIEKKTYPFHRVCGEYISNEAMPFLKRMGLYPEQFSPPQINRFQLSSISGKHATIPLHPGGFGISRYHFDNYLYEQALKEGVVTHLNTEAGKTSFQNGKFIVNTQSGSFEADALIGAFGKRSKLDIMLNRDFIKKRSPYAGIKYHVKTDHPRELICLHNFEGGYCGMSNVENDITNLCYLTHREPLRKLGSIEALEHEVLFKNPVLKSIFTNADFIFTRPEVINEISFETKGPVNNHILMVGDAAGMITPLCGNGMAMAIHAGKLASHLVAQFCMEKISRQTLETAYAHEWKKIFSKRLWNGRQIQQLFGNHFLSNAAVNLMLHFKPLANFIVSNTHGQSF